MEFWNLFGSGDGARLDAMESDFRTDYPEINLESTAVPWGLRTIPSSRCPQSAGGDAAVLDSRLTARLSRLSWNVIRLSRSSVAYEK